jgi:hypothetical protein
MTPPASPPRERRLLDRLLALTLLLPSGTVLAVAAWLEPDPAGVGTHRQLGLGGCTLLQLTGWPCPMCGMTTTFSLAAHGRLVEALLCQPYGLVLFALTLATALVSLVELVRPRGRWRGFWDWLGLKEGWVAAGLLLGLLAGWLYKLWVTLGPFAGGLEGAGV